MMPNFGIVQVKLYDTDLEYKMADEIQSLKEDRKSLTATMSYWKLIAFIELCLLTPQIITLVEPLFK